jgi:ABC-type lipoprotein export system ATPase subunit
MLKIENCSRTWRGPQDVRALSGVSIEVRPGEFVAVHGPSGCGKTTLLLVAGGLLQPDSGRVTVGGEDLYALPPDRRARARAARIGFVFQQFHLLPYLDVLGNVLAPTLALRTDGAEARARELLDRLGLAPRMRHKPNELSAGEQQRTALARALLNKPGLLLADEPTGNLDEAAAEGVLGGLEEFARGGGAVLLVTHNPKAVARAGRAVRMENGAIA